jgi:hypothetical protein
VLRVGLNKKLDPTQNKSAISFAENNQGPTLLIINHILMVS